MKEIISSFPTKVHGNKEKENYLPITLKVFISNKLSGVKTDKSTL